MAKIKLSDYFIQKLSELDVKHFFLVSGGGAMHLNDSLGKAKNISFTCTHHEQAAAMAAESFSRVSDSIGACMVTTGPGGTNTVTGVLGAWLDSVPVIYISGQVKRSHLMNSYPGLRQFGVQEANIISIVKSITKYAVSVTDPNQIGYHLEKAIYLARHGRQGPVWIDLPLDVQSALIDTKKLKRFNQSEFKKDSNSNNLLKEQVAEVVKMLKASKRPIMVAGMGIRLGGNYSLFRELVGTLGIPLASTMTSHDLLPYQHRLNAGRFGAFAERAGNFAVQKSDLVLSLESRLSMWDTGYDIDGFAPRAKKIIIENDESEFLKPTMKPALAIKSNTKEFMKELLQSLAEAPLPSYSDWAAEIKSYQKKYPVNLPEYKNIKNNVNSYFFTDALSGILPKSETIVTGVGTAFTGTSQVIKLKEGQRLCMNVGCASMGYDLPAAIGACYANNKKRVTLLVGDGGIQMNIQELQTIVSNGLPIKIFVLNNLGYLAIRNTQKNYFSERYVGSSLDSGLSFPNLSKISKAYGIPYLKISNQKNIKQKIKIALKKSGPVLCEIMMDPDQELIPRLSSAVNKDGSMSSRPLEDMYPFIDRKELEEIMADKSKLKKKDFIPGETYIPVSGKVFDQDEVDNLIKTANDGWWTEGEFGKQFEAEFKKFLGVDYVSLVNSGSSANLLALFSLTSSVFKERQLKPGDEFITTSVAFPTTVNPGVMYGLKPVFIDAEVDTLNIDPDQIEKAITPKTKLIMIAHTLGRPFDLDKIQAICKKYNLWLIEDCCDALGTKYKGKYVSTFGDISTFSFYPAHQMTMGEGGAVVTNNPLIHRSIRQFRDWGRDCWCDTGKDNTCGKRFGWKFGELPEGFDHKYIYTQIGFNLKLTDFQAAIGVAQIKKLPEFIKIRQNNYQQLYQVFNQYKKYFTLMKNNPDDDFSYFGLPVVVRDNAPFTRNQFTEYLEEKKIGTRNIFSGNLLRHPAYLKKKEEIRVIGKMTNADLIMNNAFWVGVWPGIDSQRISYISKSIDNFLNQQSLKKYDQEK